MAAWSPTGEPRDGEGLRAVIALDMLAQPGVVRQPLGLLVANQVSRSADHEPTKHKLTEHRPTERKPVKHRPTERKLVKHRPTEHRPTEHGPTEHTEDTSLPNTQAY
eukprot:4326628-Pyramimonas_sp.AAC.1